MGAAEEPEYSIKPENVTPAIPTSEWPLLLKNYDKCTISAHSAITELSLTMVDSTRAHRPLHPHSLRLHTAQA
jgi:hypothetical protein